MSLRARRIINCTVTREQTTAQETWLCDWNESVTQALQFVGGYQGSPPHWIPPAGFTELPGLKAESCDIIPFGDLTDSGGYTTAMLTVSYGVLKPSEENNDPNQIYEAQVSFGGEGFQISGKNHYKWASGTNSGKPLPDDVYVTKILASMEINCNFRYRPTLPVDVVNSCQGKLNNAAIVIGTKNFTVGTVLFNGAGATPGQSTDGTNGWSRELKFLVKNDGWNKLWSPDTSSWETITPSLYELTDLSQLFSS